LQGLGDEEFNEVLTEEERALITQAVLIEKGGNIQRLQVRPRPTDSMNEHRSPVPTLG
jgi:hypothetical protein